MTNKTTLTILKKIKIKDKSHCKIRRIHFRFGNQRKKMDKICIAIVLFLVICAFSEAQVCKNTTECATGMCCYIEPEFLVMSKRQAGILPMQVHTKHDTGVCEKYRLLHDQCGTFEKMNGHCGCGTGMSCQWVPDTPFSPQLISNRIVRRRPISHSEPGAYRCALCSRPWNYRECIGIYKILDDFFVRDSVRFKGFKGVCENYRLMGDHCAPLETMNGHCGCMTGFHCQWVAEPTTPDMLVVSKRGMVYHPGPGAYKCA